jgi:predicted TIM-barrel fold metal-dependent hydrolase
VSFVSEGVFQKFPGLKLVLIESGVTWLPPLLWRTSKLWRGVRPEVPWLDRSPAEIIRDHVRLTLQPIDASDEMLKRTLDHIGSDEMLLFSTDFPHWQFDGDEMLPPGLSPALREKILIGNPLATYPRLGRPS